jgi:hypothetical protein
VSADQIRQIAALSAQMDTRHPGPKLAIVAPRDFEFGLGRMYQSYRSLEPAGTKQIEVFRSVPEAMAWLDVEPTVWA